MQRMKRSRNEEVMGFGDYAAIMGY